MVQTEITDRVFSERNSTRVWGYSGLALSVAVWIFSVPDLGFVTDVFGYSPAWMFAMLAAGCLGGVIATVRDEGWWIGWVAVVISSFTALLMLVFNNV